MSIRNAIVEFHADGGNSIELVIEGGQRVLSSAMDWPSTLRKLDEMVRAAGVGTLVLPSAQNSRFNEAKLHEIEARLSALEGAVTAVRSRTYGS